MKPRTCSYCGQVLPEYRMNIRMTKIQARIFDLVIRGGIDGIPTGELFALTYQDKTSRHRSRQTLKAHVYQMNELLEEHGYRITGYGGAYRLIKKFHMEPEKCT